MLLSPLLAVGVIRLSGQDFAIPVAEPLVCLTVFANKNHPALVSPVATEIHVIEGHAVPQALGDLGHRLRAHVTGISNEEMLGLQLFEEPLGLILGESEFFRELLESPAVNFHLLFGCAQFACGENRLGCLEVFHKILSISQREVGHRKFDFLTILGHQKGGGTIKFTQSGIHRGTFQ